MTNATRQPVYLFEGFRLDAQRRVLHGADGQPIPLTPRLFDTLLYFVERAGQLLTKEQLMEALWPRVVVEEHNLNKTVSELRRVLGEKPGEHRFFVTQPGRGYRFVAAVAVASSAEREPSSGPPEPAASPQPLRVERRWGAAAVIGVVAAITILSWIASRESADSAAPPLVPRAVAVLPFTTLGAAETYLADGITEAVTRELGQLEETRVIASSSAFVYRGSQEGFRQIGRELGVALMVRGSVQQNGDIVRVSAALIDVEADTTLWSDSYDRDFANTLAVQDEIAWQVAAHLAGTLGREPPERRRQKPQASPEAYDAYLRALASLRGDSRTADYVARMSAAATELERAIALDGDFALARARLASVYTQRFFYDAADVELERRAFLEVERALALSPDLPEAYVARSQLMWNLRNGFPHESAIADLRRAIAGNPNLAEAHVEIGKIYYHIGLLDEAIAANEQALRLDPLADIAIRRRVGAEIDAGMTERVRDEVERNPQWPRATLLPALVFLDREDEALRLLGITTDVAANMPALEMNDAALAAQVLARLQRRDDALAVLPHAIVLAENPTGLSDTHHAQFAIGCAYALLGEPDEAIEWVTKAANEGYPSYPRFSSEPDLASLSGDPRFEALLVRLQRDHERWQSTL